MEDQLHFSRCTKHIIPEFVCDVNSTLHVGMPNDMDLETTSRVLMFLYNLTMYDGKDYAAVSFKGSPSHIRSTLLQACRKLMQVDDADLIPAFVLGDTAHWSISTFFLMRQMNTVSALQRLCHS